MNREMTGSGRIVWLALMAVLFIGCSAFGKVIYVDDDAAAPGDGTSWATAYRFLQDALVVAQAGDAIRVARGLYRPDRSSSHPEGTGQREVSFEVPDGTFLQGGFAGLGAEDPNERDTIRHGCVLSGDLNGNDLPVSDPCDLMDAPSRLDNAYHVVRLSGGILEGVEVTGGYAHRYVSRMPYTRSFTTDHAGGGISGYGTARDCMICANYAEEAGGGLWCDRTREEADQISVSMQHCRFIGNATRNWGGGMYLGGNCEAEFQGCEFRENWGGRGGAGLCRDAFLDVLGTSFFTNRSDIGSGGLSLDDSVGDFEACAFSQNVSISSGGGGLSLVSSKAKVVRCALTRNVAGSGAGAISGNSSDIELEQCLLVGNQSEEHGGAVAVRRYSSALLVNCTVVENRAPEGSFLSAGRNSSKPAPSSVAVQNCVVCQEGQVIWNYDTVIDVAYTRMPSPQESWYDPNEDIEIGAGCIEVDPCFVDPGYWNDNGTPDDPNDDFFVEGDYHLKSQAGRWDPNIASWVQDDVTSPCIDAGDPNSYLGDEPFPNGGVINMGAYGGTAQASKSYFGAPLCETIIAGDINGDCQVDVADIVILLDHWLQSGEP